MYLVYSIINGFVRRKWFNLEGCIDFKVDLFTTIVHSQVEAGWLHMVCRAVDFLGKFVKINVGPHL